MNEEDLRAKHYVKNADGSWSKTKLPVGSQVKTNNLSGPVHVATVQAGKPQLHPSENPLVEVSRPGKPLAAEGKRIRQDKKPLLNKLETEWLYKLQECYPSTMIWSQALRWKLGNGIWYKPDFVLFAGWTQKPTELTCYEVKGPHAFRGGFENLKVAASLYPEVRWVLVWKESKTWQQQEVLP